ncbi:MAG: metal-dependent hydrolase [Candidatus Thiodiazotropha endolucinida]|nr:metal-dependent hydrolase [Candidatus Thiodiazotropha taylori]MCW4319264.1 metal-dependent hydrolase [Candidatus Thiodiazotropha taylori]
MDTITHALFGAVCSAALPRTPSTSSSELPRRMAITGMAAAFPDIDYLGFWIDPLLFLADWHRSATHSLLLTPLWAALLTLCCLPWQWARNRWRMVYGLCCLGLLSHLPLDLLTPFGIKLFYPLATTAYSMAISFFTDGYFTAIIVVTLLLLLWHPPRRVALSGLLILSTYLSGLWLLKTEALQVAAQQFPQSTDLHALPQPFSPFYWQLIEAHETHHQVAYLSLTAEHQAIIKEYQGRRNLVWKTYHLFGEQTPQIPLVETAWQHDQLHKFRQFAHFPILYRMDSHGDETCIWFTDLRYTLPYLTPPFRYGMCRDQQEWKIHRLKRFTTAERQAL